MPIEDFLVYDYYNISGQTVAFLSDGGQPYRDMTSDATGILGKLLWISLTTNPPPGCGDQTFILGLLPQNVEWHFDDGEGTVSGLTRRNRRALLVRMSASQDSAPWTTARGGFTLAHELGHDYGRRHIKCGNFPDDQQNFDSNAPFDSCHLSYPYLDTISTHFGFDPLTLSVIDPTKASDIMSYMAPHWSSVNYYTYLFDRTVGDNKSEPGI